jgi:hypothetical protein
MSSTSSRRIPYRRRETLSSSVVSALNQPQKVVLEDLSLKKQSHLAKYSAVFLDDSFDFPMKLTRELMARMDYINSNSKKPLFLARAIYESLLANISYDASHMNQTYKNSVELWRDKKGVCGEMSYLYIACARYVGLDAAYINVEVDCFGSLVNHACAGVTMPPNYLATDNETYRTSHKTPQIVKTSQSLFTKAQNYIDALLQKPRNKLSDASSDSSIDSKIILVDIAYQAFDVKHQQYTQSSDLEAYKRYLAMRYRNPFKSI